MKRAAGDNLSAPPLKRVSSTLTDLGMGDDDDKLSEHYHLRSQNKALAFEIRKNKLHLEGTKNEISLLRKKTNDMQSLVSVIQRSWSQLIKQQSCLIRR